MRMILNTRILKTISRKSFNVYAVPWPSVPFSIWDLVGLIESNKIESFEK